MLRLIGEAEEKASRLEEAKAERMTEKEENLDWSVTQAPASPVEGAFGEDEKATH